MYWTEPLNRIGGIALQTGEFLNLVLGSDQDGHIELKTEDFQLSRWFQWPAKRTTLTKYVELRDTEDVWFSAMLFSKTDRQAENATTTHAVYMDADECHPDNFRVPPSLVVRTSEGRWQVYWVLDRAYKASEVWDVAHKIAVAHKRQGCDPSGWVPSKMMRIPGTLNLKRAIPDRVQVESHHEDHVYTLASLEEAYSDISLSKVQVQTEATPETTPELLDCLDKLPDEVFDLYDDEVLEGGSWSERMWALLMGMFDADFTPEEAFTVSQNAKCNKYAPENAGKRTQQGSVIPLRTDPEGTLWREVRKAYQAHTDGAVEAPTEADLADVGDRNHPAGHKGFSFLTDEERELVENTPSFIDDYVQWVASNTDSSERYQRSLAWMLLANVFGQHAYINTSFGALDLNLWMLVLGDSTFTRKSTAVKLMLRVLHEFERFQANIVDIGSDFTPEGLNNKLGERDGLVSLVHRDEIQGFFREVFTKTYMAGAMERMTSLYDGNVQVSMRANKDSGQSKRAHTIFNIIGIGIKDEIPEVLTAQHFASGFLARFLWAVDDTPAEITRDMVVIGEKTYEHDSVSRDATIDRFVEGFGEAIQTLTDDFSRVKIVFNPETKERFDDWCVQIAGISDPIFKTEQASLIPATERLKISVWKAAALLAFQTGYRTIEDFHLYHALAQAELWYEDMYRMANLVSASDFERKVQKVEHFIAEAANQSRKRSTIYRKFASHRTGEVDEWIDYLVKSGIVSGTKELTLVSNKLH